MLEPISMFQISLLIWGEEGLWQLSHNEPKWLFWVTNEILIIAIKEIKKKNREDGDRLSWGVYHEGVMEIHIAWNREEIAVKR